MSPPRRRTPLSTYGVPAFALSSAIVGLLILSAEIPKIHTLIAGYPWDFVVDQLTARGYLDHVNPFTDRGVVSLGLARFGNSGSGHPPTTSFWALPVAHLSPEIANTVVGTVTLLLLLIEFSGIFGALGWPAVPSLCWLSFAYVVSCSFMRYHLGVGQFSEAIGFLYFVSWRAGRRGDELLSGIALGLACTMKLFPGVVVLLLVIQGRWRGVCAAAAAYLAIAAVMTSRFGLASWPYFFGKQSAIASAWMASIQNQSIHGVVLRMFYPVCKGGSGIVPIAMILSTGISVILLALAGWWARQSRSPRSEGADVAFALFVVLSVITSQWSWEHYTVIYILPTAILLDRLGRTFIDGDKRVTTGVMLLLAVGVVAAWQIDINIKTNLRASYFQGNRGDHLRLHLYDFLNWGPAYTLALLLFLVLRRSRFLALSHDRARQTRSVAQ